MKSFASSLAVLTGLSVSAFGYTFPPAHSYSRFATRQSGINWVPCFGNSNMECGRYETPLDWANEAVGKTSLAVIRYKATSTPKLGSLFINPGGPGGSGVQAIAGGDGEYISNITGGFYDIVSWDPRGVNNTLPRVDCFSTGREEQSFWAGTIASTGLEARTNFTEQADLDAFYAQAPEIDTLLTELGQRCTQLSGDNLKYIGSAAVVRDMVAMTDLLDGQGALVNYWGFSYGTIIGAYFVNMFPKRVGRVIIDGVVNPFVWSQQRSVNGWGDAIQSTDEAFDGFTEACAAAGAIACSVSGGRTPAQIKLWTLALIDAVYFARQQGFQLGSSDIRNRIHLSMYSPKSWPDLADFLLKVAQALTGSSTKSKRWGSEADLLKWRPNVNKSSFSKRSSEDNAPEWKRSNLVSGFDWRALSTAYLRDLSLKPANPSSSNRFKRQGDDPAPDYSFQAITCADAVDAGSTTTSDVFDELVRVSREVSPMFGPVWGDASLYCHRWPARAVERFTGPFNSPLSNEILVIGNEADPITPFVSAKAVADSLGDGAILLEQDNWGHASLAMHSDCTIDVVAQYFISGVLPTVDGKLCGTNQPLFTADDNVEVDKVASISAIPEPSATGLVGGNGVQPTATQSVGGALRQNGSAVVGVVVTTFFGIALVMTVI